MTPYEFLSCVVIAGIIGGQVVIGTTIINFHKHITARLASRTGLACAACSKWQRESTISGLVYSSSLAFAAALTGRLLELILSIHRSLCPDLCARIC